MNTAPGPQPSDFAVTLNNGFDATAIDVLLEDSPEPGFSRPFLVAADDGHHYWLKQVRPGFERCMATEQVVAGCAELLGASVCGSAKVAIPAALDGHKLSTGVILREGIAHGSLHIESALAKKNYSPEHRERDNNSARHAGYIALCVWCYGNDHQWIYDFSDDYATYSHDHGAFLDFDWTWPALEQQLQVQYCHSMHVQGLNQNEVNRLVEVLRTVEVTDVVDIVSRVPASWNISESNLEALARFLFMRAGSAADVVSNL